eukprot:GHVS01106345.1.p1 GENE.GHVS01106345.1~~GHVS01106345.1.p1  ORF type:complete len:679 (-),score=104.77 GHVS01106345.1:100-2136(-)
MGLLEESRNKHERKQMPIHKYSPFPPIAFDDVWSFRRWPNKVISESPRWCSVDLRDGNQALINPMTVEKKLVYFRLLVSMGFKEIELGFPSASNIDFEFCRHIITKENIPNDLWLSVLVQSRAELIERTVEALQGADNVIIHLYNSTSTLQREVVFRKSRDETIKLAVSGTELIRNLVDNKLRSNGTNVRLQYSPESFTGTELEFSLQICEAVARCWSATPTNKMILNLPATVEMSTPNIFADMIEWIMSHLTNNGYRDCMDISVHTHNDRGTAVAATELSMLAGVDRVEGCLFGNGERTGNVCLLTLAMNLFTQGTDPQLDLSNMSSVVRLYQDCTEMPVHPRHPWAGSLVLTAFSGSHQDAIRKGLEAVSKRDDRKWQVPYLPVDPADIGRTYEAVVRINAQSGKGGVAFVLENHLGITIPRDLQMDFSRIVQTVTDRTAKELSVECIVELFFFTYVCNDPTTGGIAEDLFLVVEDSWKEIDQPENEQQQQQLDIACNSKKEITTTNKPHSPKRNQENTAVHLRGNALIYGKEHTLSGIGTGPVDAFVSAVNTFEHEHFPERASAGKLSVTSLFQTSVRGTGESDAEAMSFVRVHRATAAVLLTDTTTTATVCTELSTTNKGEDVDDINEGLFGVGMDRSIVMASMKAICSSINRLLLRATTDCGNNNNIPQCLAV